jgi:hypothetical protein
MSILLLLLLQASVLALYEMTVQSAAAAGEAPPLPVLQTLVAAAAEVAPGSGTHLCWASSTHKQQQQQMLVMWLLKLNRCS